MIAAPTEPARALAVAFLSATLCGCEIVNFGMNVADRLDIEHIFDYLYVDEVERAQGAGEDPPTFEEWTKSHLRSRIDYVRYFELSKRHSELNSAPIDYSEWARLDPDARPKAKAPKTPMKRLGARRR